MSGVGKGKNTEALYSTFEKFAGAWENGGTGSDDIVNQQYVFALDAGRRDKAEGIGNVSLSFLLALSRLAFGKDHSSNGIRYDRDACSFAYAYGNMVRLVVASFLLPLFRQGDRNDDIYAFKNPESLIS